MSSHLARVRQPALSLWHSLLHEVIARPEGNNAGLHLSERHEVLQAAVLAANELEEGKESPALAAHKSSRTRACARLFARKVLAYYRGDEVELAALKGELKYLTCDPLWLEAWTAFEASRLTRHHSPLYVRHQSLEDFVLPPIPDTATVALIADFGTGTPEAYALLEQLAAFSPDVVLHLGDIYYAGTRHEVQAHFLDVFSSVFGTRGPRVYSLAGNHDRYSGGRGYQLLLESLGQPASYFCLRNAYWQLLAMDTGLHDFNPRVRGGTLTWLEPSEAEWLTDKLRRSEWGTILFSHHPYFSFTGTGRNAKGELLALNPHLEAVIGPFVRQVATWFWGHEHNLLVFEPYAGLSRGRCIGASSIPRLVNEQINSPVRDLRCPSEEDGPPQRVPGTSLANDGVEDFHAYALLRLERSVATANYYQIGTFDLLKRRTRHVPEPCFRETFTKSALGVENEIFRI